MRREKPCRGRRRPCRGQERDRDFHGCRDERKNGRKASADSRKPGLAIALRIRSPDSTSTSRSQIPKIRPYRTPDQNQISFSPLENIMAASSQSGSGQYRSGRKFWLLGGAILLVIALYTGGWFYAASALKQTVLTAIAPRADAGVTGECSDIEFRGFPFRIGLFCSKVDIDDNVNGISATFGTLRSAAQV